MLITRTSAGMRLTPKEILQENKHLYAEPCGTPYTKDEVIRVVDNYQERDRLLYRKTDSTCMARDSSEFNLAVECSMPSNLRFGSIMAARLQDYQEAIGFAYRRGLGGWILVVKRPRPIINNVWVLSGDLLEKFEIDMSFLPLTHHIFHSSRDAWKFLKVYSYNNTD